MKTQTLQQKLDRYLSGQAMPAETRQIQSWLSCTSPDIHLSPEKKLELEQQLLQEIQAETAYPLFYPKKEKPWWQKVVGSFL